MAVRSFCPPAGIRTRHRAGRLDGGRAAGPSPVARKPQRGVVDRPGNPQGRGRPYEDCDRGAFPLGHQLRDPHRQGARTLRRGLDGRHHSAPKVPGTWLASSARRAFPRRNDPSAMRTWLVLSIRAQRVVALHARIGQAVMCEPSACAGSVSRCTGDHPSAALQARSPRRGEGDGKRPGQAGSPGRRSYASALAAPG